MKKILLATLSLVLMSSLINAQTYKTRDGYIYFNPNKDQSHKDYESASKEATAILKVETGDVALLVPMKTFHFNNALLEEHFNENYLHTNKFPNASYKGKLIGFNKNLLAKDGVYNLTSEGQVTLHGVTKNFKSPVKLEVKGKTATYYCVFKIKAEDYNIDIPGLVKPKLSEETPLTATINFQLN
ncbi:YceI-like domain protein [mine drainage metagenome]|uniref:YceI-like domain protein n=1 Tax=mine drainage metagenome TaxID=410659 RepID=A0A1J5T450_9ZZZZ